MWILLAGLVVGGAVLAAGEFNARRLHTQAERAYAQCGKMPAKLLGPGAGLRQIKLSAICGAQASGPRIPTTRRC